MTHLWRRRLAAGGLVVVVVVAALTAWSLIQTANAGEDGRRALVATQRALAARDVDAARRHAAAAEDAFADVDRALGRIGPLRAVAKVVPLLRVQVRGVEAFADAGEILAHSASDLVETAATVIDPGDRDVPISQALTRLRAVHAAAAEATAEIERAEDRVGSLRGKRLLGRLGTTTDDLLERLDEVGRQARSATSGLEAIIRFAGGDGPRRYLVFSQNPDEPRPTGGFIGTYGVLRAGPDGIDLERFASIESWYKPRPQAVVPFAEAPNAFRIPDPPEDQTLANVNATPDWPSGAQLALRLWEQGGEAPVDGAVAITPEFLARVVGVLGPVTVPEYGEEVTAKNLVERMDHYTHLQIVPGTNRKDFVVQLAEAVVQKMLDAPASAWDDLATAIGTSFDAREGIAWSTDTAVSEALAARRWDGLLPEFSGDFFFQGEFSAAAKNGRALRRSFDHRVELRPDGSALVDTRVTIRNTAPLSEEGLLNIDSLSYITVYGPFSATLHEQADVPYAVEPSISGHPGWGGDRSAAPLGEDHLRVTWEVPQLLLRRPDGTMEYRLWWWRVIGNRGDTLTLDVRPPKGWRWRGEGPPRQLGLTSDVRGAWVLERSGD